MLSSMLVLRQQKEMVMEAMAMVETVMVGVMVEMEMVLAEMVPVETVVPELVSAVHLAIRKTWRF